MNKPFPQTPVLTEITLRNKATNMQVGKVPVISWHMEAQRDYTQGNRDEQWIEWANGRCEHQKHLLRRHCHRCWEALQKLAEEIE